MVVPMDEAWHLISQGMGDRYHLGGSTGASKYTLPSGASFVQKPGGSMGQSANEYDMNQYLNALGVGVPEAALYGNTFMSRFEDAIPYNVENPAHRSAVRQDIAPHAAIANWDILGMVDDNVLIRPDGTPTYVDVGGAGPYRAMGSPKGAAFGPDVTMIDRLANMPSHTSRGKTFGGLTDEEVGQSFDRYGGQTAFEDALQFIRDNQTRKILQQRIGNISRRVA